MGLQRASSARLGFAGAAIAILHLDQPWLLCIKLYDIATIP